MRPVRWSALPTPAAGKDPAAETATVAHTARDELLPLLRVMPSTDLWDRVVALADSTTAPDHVELRRSSLAAVADLLDAARAQLIHLWSDFARARRHAHNGVWSGECEYITDRITNLTLLVGPCSWRNVEPEPLRDGTYRALHAALGIDPGIDEAELAAFLDRPEVRGA